MVSQTLLESSKMSMLMNLTDEDRAKKKSKGGRSKSQGPEIAKYAKLGEVLTAAKNK